jgi:hypothetical protein
VQADDVAGAKQLPKRQVGDVVFPLYGLGTAVAVPIVDFAAKTA